VRLEGAALQPDGKIVLAGGSDVRVAVARLHPNGSLDTGCSGDGKKTFSWRAFSRASAVLVRPDGKIVLAGFSGPEGGNIEAARLNANGKLDATFGTGGKASVDFGGDDFGLAMARQADGRILIAGRSSAAGAVVARLRANGTLDADFDGDGRVTLPGGGSRRRARVAGRQNRRRGHSNGNEVMTVTRLQPNGRPTRRLTGTARRQSTSGRSPTSPATRCCRRTARSSSPATRRPTRTSRSRASTPTDLRTPRLAPPGRRRRLRRRHVRQRSRFQPNGRIVVAGQRTGGDDFAVTRLLG
jgi:uncharacterized delta-60 repeat protein